MPKVTRPAPSSAKDIALARKKASPAKFLAKLPAITPQLKYGAFGTGFFAGGVHMHKEEYHTDANGNEIDMENDEFDTYGPYDWNKGHLTITEDMTQYDRRLVFGLQFFCVRVYPLAGQVDVVLARKECKCKSEYTCRCEEDEENVITLRLGTYTFVPNKDDGSSSSDSGSEDEQARDDSSDSEDEDARKE